MSTEVPEIDYWFVTFGDGRLEPQAIAGVEVRAWSPILEDHETTNQPTESKVVLTCCFFLILDSYLGDDPILTDSSVYFVQPESSKDDWNSLQHNQFNSGNKKCFPKNMLCSCYFTFIHIRSMGVGFTESFCSETFGWAHVQQRFLHQMLNTDAQMGGSRKQAWLFYT